MYFLFNGDQNGGGLHATSRPAQIERQAGRQVHRQAEVRLVNVTARTLLGWTPWSRMSRCRRRD